MTGHQEEDDITITNPISPKDNNATKEEKSRRRILFLSLEFNYAPFSGNGVLARSLVSSLVTRSQKKEGGGDCEVRVICGRPHSSVIGLSKDICMRSSLNAKTNDRNNEVGDNVDDGDSKSDLEIWPIDLPQKCQWKRLDRFGPWEEFASACGSGGFSEQSQFVDRVREFQPTDVVAVDWHGMLAWESICRAFYMSGDENENDGGGEVSWQPSCANVCYYNFRVYSASSWEHADSGEEETCDDQLFYHDKEQLSCRLADAIICLAEHDRGTLQRLVEEDGDTTTISCEELPTNERRRRSVKDIHILHPPLRGDIWELASSMADIEDTTEFNQYLPTEIKDAIQQSPIASEHQRRMLITCCARLSPEKSPHHFTALLQQLGGIDFLRRRSLIPVICGARSVEGYAEKVVTDFQSFCSKSSSSGDSDGYSWPCVVIDHHLGPKELAAVFSHTVVNVHVSICGCLVPYSFSPKPSWLTSFCFYYSPVYTMHMA